MKCRWTIIGVDDVPTSFRWYPSLFGQPETRPGAMPTSARSSIPTEPSCLQSPAARPAHATASPSKTHRSSPGTRSLVPSAITGRTPDSVCHNSTVFFAYAGSRATARSPTSAFAE